MRTFFDKTEKGRKWRGSQNQKLKVKIAVKYCIYVIDIKILGDILSAFDSNVIFCQTYRRKKCSNGDIVIKSTI